MLLRSERSLAGKGLCFVARVRVKGCTNSAKKGCRQAFSPVFFRGGSTPVRAGAFRKRGASRKGAFRANERGPFFLVLRARKRAILSVLIDFSITSYKIGAPSVWPQPHILL